MNEINIVFLHPWVKSLPDMVNYMHLWNKELVDCMVWNPQNPDYVFVSEHIYKNKIIEKKFKDYYKDEDRIFVFYGSEAVYPDLNIFDYAISMSKDFECGDRVSKIPAEFFFFEKKEPDKNELSIKGDQSKEKVNNRKFCNFIYSNPYANPIRDQLFLQLCKYKKVDSLGMHLNNTKLESTRKDENWLDISIALKSQYKFSIAIENVLFEGATTEKLLSSFRAHSVPIYWGNPQISKEYNDKAFINCHEYESINDIIKKIKQIDNDNELWEQMIKEPWQTEEQREKTEYDMQMYQKFIENIFIQDIKKAKRRPEGSFPNTYKRWFWDSNGFCRKVIRKLRGIRLRYRLYKEMENILDGKN